MTENQLTMKLALKAFSDAAYAKYGSDSFAAGYTMSLVEHMLPYLSKAGQKEILEGVITSAQKLEQDVIEGKKKG